MGKTASSLLNTRLVRRTGLYHAMVGKEVGPYRILQKIAQGGMSSVYKGLHIGLEQEVAIKVLSPESFEDPGLRDRFISEAKIQARLSHPNVIKTLNYLENDGTIFMVMEYVNGESLDILLKRGGSLPVERAVAIFTSVLDAIEFMHSKGIIHRDIKPANIMLSYDRYVKVMDFGIAKVMGENGKTKAGIRVGTLWYMSPEQIRGEDATVLTDIYSLGITLYQLVTGRVPFTGELEFDIMRGHLEEAPDSPWKINKDISRTLGEIILKAIAKKPKDRFQSIGEFSEALNSAMKIHGPGETKVLQVTEDLVKHPMLYRFSWSKRHVVFAILVTIITALTASAIILHGKGLNTVTQATAVKEEREGLPEMIKTENSAEAPEETSHTGKPHAGQGNTAVTHLHKKAPESQTLHQAPKAELSKMDEKTGWSIRK